jgi:hypothetical protein
LPDLIALFGFMQEHFALAAVEVFWSRRWLKPRSNRPIDAKQ